MVYYKFFYWANMAAVYSGVVRYLSHPSQPQTEKLVPHSQLMPMLEIGLQKPYAKSQ
jgi:hypothetical protein